jgi:hypothetical protein
MKRIALKEASIYRQEIRPAVDAGQMMGVLTLLLRMTEFGPVGDRATTKR